MAATVVRCFSSYLRPTIRVLQKCMHQSKPTSSTSIFTRTITVSSSLFADKKFSTDHEWVLMEDDSSGKIGITDYAQDKLGDVVFIELPEVGSTFAREDTFGTVESVKAASDVVSPVSGEILEVNSTLEESPEIVNSDPYEEGWLIKMKLSDTSELDDLMTESEYEKYIQDCD